MTATITGATPHSPDLFQVYNWKRTSNTRSRDIPATVNRAHTLRPASLRVGRFRALYSSLTAAIALDDDLKTARTFTLGDTDHPEFAMTFLVPEGGAIDLELDTRTYNRWTLTFDFEEI